MKNVFKRGYKLPQGKYYFDVTRRGKIVKGFLTLRDIGVLRRCVELSATEETNIVEVGSWLGRSTIAMADMLRECEINGKVYAIDPHNGYRGLSEPKGPPTFSVFWRNVKLYELENYIRPIIAETRNVTWDKPVNMLFIDGLHDYDNVKLDFDTFDSNIIKGGFVCFHDYGRSALPDVKRFVDAEVLPRKEYKRFYAHPWLIAIQKVNYVR